MQPDRTKARILAATDALFGERGFDATSTRDIAERSGVNKALIHYHFHAKEDLLGVLLDGYYERLTVKLLTAFGQRPTLVEQVEDVLDAYADFLACELSRCAAPIGMSLAEDYASRPMVPFAATLFTPVVMLFATSGPMRTFPIPPVNDSAALSPMMMFVFPSHSSPASRPMMMFVRPFFRDLPASLPSTTFSSSA